MIKLLAVVAAIFLGASPLLGQDTENTVNGAYENEVNRLIADPRMRTAFEHVANHHDGRLRDLVTLNQIPAPPFGEGPRGLAFADMMRATGFGEVEIDGVGNVIARRAGRAADSGSVMVAAHLDTVFPAETDVTVQVDGNRFTGPGIGDNTRGLVMLLQIAAAIEAAGFETERDILLVGNVGEEGLGDLSGVRHLFREGARRPDSFIAIDGGSSSRIVNSAIGSNRYRVSFRGAGGHSWSDFGAANPHHAAARAIAAFADAARPVTQQGERSSFSVGRVGGGTSVNSIPFESWFEVDMRSGDPERLAALDAVFRQAMQDGLDIENSVLVRGDALIVDIEPIGRRPAGQGDPDAAIVGRMQAIMRADGIDPELAASSTDSNVPISLGIPAITISRCGTSARAHSLEEYWIDDDDTIPCTLRGLRIVLLEAGVRLD